jgi:hypothetical protein
MFETEKLMTASIDPMLEEFKLAYRPSLKGSKKKVRGQWSRCSLRHALMVPKTAFVGEARARRKWSSNYLER